MGAPAARDGSFPKLQEHEASAHIIAADREQSPCSGSWSDYNPQRLASHDPPTKAYLISKFPTSPNSITQGPSVQTDKPGRAVDHQTIISRLNSDRSKVTKKVLYRIHSPPPPRPSARLLTRLPSVSDSARHDSLIPAEEVRRHGRTRHGKIFS